MLDSVLNITRVQQNLTNVFMANKQQTQISILDRGSGKDSFLDDTSDSGIFDWDKATISAFKEMKFELKMNMFPNFRLIIHK